MTKRGLVGAWCPSLGATGFRLFDRSGRNNHGTLTNMASTAWTTSGGKGALSFDGSNDYVLLPSVPAFQPASGDKFSISAWVFTNTSTGIKAILSHGSANGYNFYIQSNYLEFAKAGVANTGSNASLTPIAIGAWNHVALTNTVNSSVQFWINGALKRDVSFVTTYAYTNQLRIGDSQNEPGLFNGSLDDIRFHNRLLTAPEIRQLYIGGRGFGLLPERPRRRGKAAAAAFNRRRRVLLTAG